MKKYILGIVVLVVIIAVLFFTKNEKVTEQPVADTSMMIVSYTNDGFFPSELKVKAGTQVSFINQSDSPMWVASGPHPTHTLYPEFDQKATATKGQSYSFVFQKIGSHPYHNHLLLGKYGKIIVE